MKQAACLILVLSSLLPVPFSSADDQRRIPESNLKYPVLLVLPLGPQNVTFGSGFFRTKGDASYLITAKHVLFQYASVKLEKSLPSGTPINRQIYRKIDYDNNEKVMRFNQKMTVAERDYLSQLCADKGWKTAIEELFRKSQNPLELKAKTATVIGYPSPSRRGAPAVSELEFNLELLREKGNILYHPVHDVAAVRVGKIQRGTGLTGEGPVLEGIKVASGEGTALVGVDDNGFKLFDRLSEGNEVYMFGYPTSITGKNLDLDIKVPLLRKGVIAGRNMENRLVILDCPAFYGNSGGLVIEATQTSFLAIGVVSKFVPFDDKWFENAGYSIVVPMDYVEELISK